MIKAKYRAKREDIENTIKTGTTLPGEYLYAKLSKNDTGPNFAIVISKKTEKTAVGRHLIKRKIHSFLEKNLVKKNDFFKKTIVFFVKKTNKPIVYRDIEKEVVIILKKAGFFNL